MFYKKNKKHCFQKLALILILSFSFTFLPTTKTQAAWIPGLDPIIKKGLEIIYDTVDGIVLGTLKQAAIQMLNQQIDQLAGSGARGEPAFITNWQDFLIQQTEARVDTYMNDYLSQVTQGRNSISDYEGFSHAFHLSQIIETNESTEKKRPKITYEGNVEDMFNCGSFRNLEVYFSGINNPWTFEIDYQQEKEKKLEEEKFIAQTKAIAYKGFTGTPAEENDPHSVTFPGGLTESIMANTQKMPAEAIVNATSMQEVIVAIVGQVISKAIQQGFSSVQKKLQ